MPGIWVGDRELPLRALSWSPRNMPHGVKNPIFWGWSIYLGWGSGCQQSLNSPLCLGGHRVPRSLQAPITGNMPSGARPGAAQLAGHFLLSTAHLTPGLKPSPESLEPSNSHKKQWKLQVFFSSLYHYSKGFPLSYMHTRTHTPVFSPPISLGCPGNFQAEWRPERRRRGPVAWPSVRSVGLCRGGSSGTGISHPSICDWGFRGVCVWACVCELCVSGTRAVIYVHPSWFVVVYRENGACEGQFSSLWSAHCKALWLVREKM